MFSKLPLARLTESKMLITGLFSRNIASSSILQNKLDPIQQLFLDKSREYYKKRNASSTGLVDSSAETQKALKDEIEKISKQFGTSASSEFPSLNFSEPKLDPVTADKLEVKAN